MLIGSVCSLWLVKVTFQLPCMTQIDLPSTQKIFMCVWFCFIGDNCLVITAQICVLLLTFIFLPPPPRSPRESPEEMKMSAEWWRCWAAPTTWGNLCFLSWVHNSPGLLSVPSRAWGSSQGSIDQVLGESTRTSAGLTLFCMQNALCLFERECLSTSHGFAYHHTVSCLVEDFEDLLSYQKNS